MSYISNYEHQLCGVLAGVPVYYFPKDLPSSTGEFQAGPSDLVLGGGSGEHPEAVYSINELLMSFILDERLTEGAADYSTHPPLAFMGEERVKKFVEAFVNQFPLGELGTQPQWGGNTWYNFIETARLPSGIWGDPYDSVKHGSIESWIEGSLGEYALVSMTDLVVSLLPHPSLEADLRGLAQAVAHQPFYRNVAAFPTGYEYAGGSRGSIREFGNVRH